ncbi:MAG TPA: xanthine dehydrogenase family protein subunit M [Candidatus Dormibacteraeota bacterium]|nr:xanthine dehydrogenase family protein subunit M [Candidatus Dormibacteraeota bacterium]
MKPFRYERAERADVAIEELAANPRAKYLGGGTNLADLMRLGVEQPDQLVDVSRLPLDRIEEEPDGGLRIGAAVRNSDLAGDARVQERYPLLSEALLAGASGQLRNLATVAGNLLQRTRCLYFQDVTKPCNKRDPGSGCSAIEGHHRELAIFGWSESCVATHPSDMAVALAAIGAKVHVQGREGTRTIPIPGLHRLPGDRPHQDTVLEHGELIREIELPPLRAARVSTYRKVRDRAAFSFALVSLAAALEVDEGVVSEVRLALGGVAHVPWRAERAERVLEGRRPTRELFEEAAKAELSEADPLRDNAFKVPLLHGLIVSTLEELAAR